MKKKAMLLMAATCNYLYTAGNVLISLKKHNPNMFDGITIYTDEDIKKEDKEAILKIAPEVEFKIYNYHLPNKDDEKRLSYYTNLAYARFEALDYLDEYEKVVWFDTDILITGDISKLLEYGNTGLAMAQDLDPYPKNHGIHAFFTQKIEGYDMMAPAYATGVIIFSDKLKNRKLLKKCLYEKLEQYSSYITFAEQGILHLIIQDFNIEVETFPKLIYHAFTSEDKCNAKLIHFCGVEKPWTTYSKNAYLQWYENHKKWLECGGSEAYTFAPLIEKYQKYFYGEEKYQNLLFFAF